MSRNIDHDHALEAVNKRASVRGMVHKVCNSRLAAVEHGNRPPTSNEAAYLQSHLDRVAATTTARLAA
jgi:hypothetical protein